MRGKAAQLNTIKDSATQHKTTQRNTTQHNTSYDARHRNARQHKTTRHLLSGPFFHLMSRRGKEGDVREFEKTRVRQDKDKNGDDRHGTGTARPSWTKNWTNTGNVVQDKNKKWCCCCVVLFVLSCLVLPCLLIYRIGLALVLSCLVLFFSAPSAPSLPVSYSLSVALSSAVLSPLSWLARLHEHRAEPGLSYEIRQCSRGSLSSSPPNAHTRTYPHLVSVLSCVALYCLFCSVCLALNRIIVFL